jgi:hypothetical protein
MLVAGCLKMPAGRPTKSSKADAKADAAGAKLLPCPFCGLKNSPAICNPRRRDGSNLPDLSLYFVACVCGASVGMFATAAEAVVHWKTRNGKRMR